MSFAVTILCEESGQWALSVTGTLGGALVAPSQVRHLLAVAVSHIDAATDATLPDGWEPTADGINVTLTDGVPSYSRTYAFTDADGKGFNRLAPCAQDGTSLPETRAALLASE